MTVLAVHYIGLGIMSPFSIAGIDQDVPNAKAREPLTPVDRIQMDHGLTFLAPVAIAPFRSMSYFSVKLPESLKT